jgi:hypothetical protein
MAGADRISALPDELLHHVMSSLPARESVATCLLARRWRRLWKSVPGLSITGACGNPARFVPFVCNLLVFERDPAAGLNSVTPLATDGDRDVSVDTPARGSESRSGREKDNLERKKTQRV